ncbi:RNA polymerase sigma factor [Luteimonas marina]|uniref:RNA polymerase sigma factor n=1 Tax=Luteimonas marina TaxID=488485 RepID=UPI00131519D0|nr:sigma-70 family RNA polymerase sigma factor [Luteimonas marina]
MELHKARSEAEGEKRLGFEDFVRSQYNALVKFLSRRNNIEDAKEIAQESIISLLNYREKGQVSDWRPLLYRIAVNHSYKFSRKEAPYRDRPAIDGEHIADDAPTPEEQAILAQRAKLLQQAILELPPKCRRVYLLRHGHNLTRAEIAQRCDISRQMVQKHLVTAMLHLQRQVGFLRGDGL